MPGARAPLATTARRRLAGLVSATLLAMALTAQVAPSAGPVEPSLEVIVSADPGHRSALKSAVMRLGGEVGREIDIINGFVARFPSTALNRLQLAPGVRSVTVNRRVDLLDHPDGELEADPGSLEGVREAINADHLLKKGITGSGVDVALIDSGVVPVAGLTGDDKVVDGPDLSFESSAENLRYLDTYGHGTHMAGIIAGSGEGYEGIAPGARLVSVKVAGATGATDVSQVLAAIDWVVQHRSDGGLNIRVLNLSFGTDGTQPYTIDPLSYAAEVAWRRGIVVVAAAGNAGYGSDKLNNPAYDPYLLAVGALDDSDTRKRIDDVVPEWSSRGDGVRNPDLVAPGKSIVSLRNPGSEIDLTYPEGRVGERFFRGSGTSQAAAVVSGAAALLLDKRPGLSPDQVKALFTSTASHLRNADPVAQGAGALDLKAAAAARTPEATQEHVPSEGTGSLEAARGSAHVEMDGDALSGEQDIFGEPWDATTWARNSWSQTSWSGGLWNSEVWAGDSWTRNSWSRNSWSGVVWTRNSWSRNSWSDTYWSRNSWSGSQWEGDVWARNSWSADSWSRNSWSRNSWSSAQWGEH
ncbi:MAG TPA: S8 family serine peptidase [Actinomycetota bacterium]|nr:S8 family serine peptidase [Actinomycetota bacterium]